jgi:hypothetical protein
LKTLTEIRNGYKVLSKTLLSFRESIPVQIIRMQHEMAALENSGRRPRGATDAERFKNAKVNVECCVAYTNIHQNTSPPSIGHTWT